MRILINLLPIKKGGGQQVATNLITQLSKYSDINVVYLVTENTFIHEYLLELELVDNLVVIKEGVLNRLLFSFFNFGKIIKRYKIDLIYTMFGPGLHYKDTLSVTGCAYSNLFFPEILFWREYSLIQRLKLGLIDKYRLYTTLKSDVIIFENEAMKNRATSLFGIEENRTKLILPSISEYKINKDVDDDFSDRLRLINKDEYNFLILSGWHKNKNITMVPYILCELKKNNVNDINFIITVDKKHSDSIKLYNKAKELGVEEHIIFFGAVQPNQVPILFESISAVILLSLLESFSNNIIEAWYFNKPLFISDEEWSRSICKDAAIYVRRDDAVNIAHNINSYRMDVLRQKRISIESEKELNKYPNPNEKVSLQVQFLKKIYNERHY